MVGIWDEACERELQRLVGYLKHSRANVLEHLVLENHQLTLQQLCDRLTIHVYVDASLQSPRSYHGGALVVEVDGIGSCVVDWWSRRQRIAVTSSMMAEIIGMMDGILEAGATRQFTRWPVLIECDNASANRVVEKGYSSAITNWSHALKLRVSAVKDLVELEQIEVRFVPTKANVADLFTKTFPHGELARLSRLVGMHTPQLSGKFADITGDMADLPDDERKLCAKEAAEAKRQYIREAKGLSAPSLHEMD